MPKQPVEMHPRHTESSGNMFLVIGFVVIGVALLASAGVFGYESYLTNQRQVRADELQVYEKRADNEDKETLDNLVRLENRLLAADTILNAHTMPSGLFRELEMETLENVRFLTFEYGFGDDGEIELRMTGEARTFNALAAQSEAFADDLSSIHRAIFSGISTNEEGVVQFELTAIVNPDLVTITRTVPDAWLANPAPADAPETDVMLEAELIEGESVDESILDEEVPPITP